MIVTLVSSPWGRYKQWGAIDRCHPWSRKTVAQQGRCASLPRPEPEQLMGPQSPDRARRGESRKHEGEEKGEKEQGWTL